MCEKVWETKATVIDQFQSIISLYLSPAKFPSHFFDVGKKIFKKLFRGNE